VPPWNKIYATNRDIQTITVWLMLNKVSDSYFIYSKKKKRSYEQKVLLEIFFKST